MILSEEEYINNQKKIHKEIERLVNGYRERDHIHIQVNSLVNFFHLDAFWRSMLMGKQTYKDLKLFMGSQAKYLQIKSQSLNI